MSEIDAIIKLVVLKDQGQPQKKSRELRQLATSKRVALKGEAPAVAELLQRKPGPLLAYKDALELLKHEGITLKHHLNPGQSVTLSPRRNYIEGHGHLNFVNVSHVYGENDQAWYQRHDDQPDEYRQLEIWLSGLTPGSSYLVQIRVTGDAQGSWQVRGSDTGGVVSTVAGGYMRTIPVLAHEVRYDLSLIEVEARGMWQWGFFDAVVTAL